MLKDTILGLDLQPFAYTTEEWEKMKKTHSSFAREIVKKGKILQSEKRAKPRGSVSVIERNPS
jgi:hypothetical protein